jgi:hypothetical protein
MSASIQSRNAQILLLTLVGAIPFGWRAVTSVALGGAIQIVNLRGLERTVGGILGLARDGGPVRGVQVLLWLRQLLLLGVVGTVLLLQAVEPLAFAVGLSTVVPAVLWHGLVTARQDT